MKRKTYKVIGAGINCPRCGEKTETRSHIKLRPKQLNAPYYFSQWDFCTSCHFIQMYEKYKVMNRNDAAARFQDYEEEQQRLNFIRSL